MVKFTPKVYNTLSFSKLSLNSLAPMSAYNFKGNLPNLGDFKFKATTCDHTRHVDRMPALKHLLLDKRNRL